MKKVVPTRRPSLKHRKINRDDISEPRDFRPVERIRPIASTSMDDVSNHLVTERKEVIVNEDKGLDDAIDKERLHDQQWNDEQNMERLFAGLSFDIDSIDDTLAEDLKTTLMELGGVHLDYLLLPLLHYRYMDEIVGLDVGNVVSAFWMQDCMEKEHLIDQNVHPLYRPMKASLQSYSFEGSIVALSSMERLETETYTELLKTFDAIVQNQLVERGATDGMLQRNTHVVACDEDERTACARRWRIPVVDPSWIIGSIIKDKKQEDEDFRFDGKPLKNYIRNDELWLALCHSVDRRSSERSQRESMSPEAAAVCITARSSSDDCVIIESGDGKNAVIHEDERKCEGDEVCSVETPIDSRVKLCKRKYDGGDISVNKDELYKHNSFAKQILSRLNETT